MNEEIRRLIDSGGTSDFEVVAGQKILVERGQFWISYKSKPAIATKIDSNGAILLFHFQPSVLVEFILVNLHAPHKAIFLHLSLNSY